MLDVVHEAPHLVVDRLQHPALVTPQPPQPRVFNEGVLVNPRQKDGADVELLQVLRPAEGTSLHSPEHALDVQPAQADHPLETLAVEVEGAEQQGPALVGEVQVEQGRPPDSCRDMSQLILRQVEVLQHVQVLEEPVLDVGDVASLEDEVLEVGAHAGEVVVGVSEVHKDVSCQVQPLHFVTCTLRSNDIIVPESDRFNIDNRQHQEYQDVRQKLTSVCVDIVMLSIWL